ncbi:MAG: glycoside hydrolase family protein [Verrucomicrobia bacterium]|nr:glycoside hydrolase family protein [Verrucomicrobiota bacterium]
MSTPWPSFLNSWSRRAGACLCAIAFVRLALAAAPSPASAAPVLDLGARVQPAPLTARLDVPGYFVWCGAPVRGGDGRYHLFYSRWPIREGFLAWVTHSEIAHAVADTPLGPYRPTDVALPERGPQFWDGHCTHNPNVFFHRGRYYLFYMGNRGDREKVKGLNWSHRNHQRVGVAIAEKPEGPWRRLDAPIVDVNPDRAAFDSLCVTNPAAAVRPDGGVLLIYKAVQIIEGKIFGGNVRYGAALADHPEGPYRKVPGRIFEAEGAEAQKHWMLAEDPFVWFSERYGQRYYAVARDVVGQFTGAKGGIALFHSADGLHWQPAPQPKVLGLGFSWADGTAHPSQFERPALLLEDGEPIALFGATDGYLREGKISSNVHLPLRRP